MASARDPRRPFATSPFARLARTHALGIAGDTLFAVALAGTIFFSLDFDQARTRVALYLVLTIAPFAVAAPLIGPALDRVRGGRRWVIVGCQVTRALTCLLIIRHIDSLLFYPEAFLMLILGKIYSISKSAVVPTTVRSDTELVEANSKLTVLSAVGVVVAAPIAGLLLTVGNSPTWPLGLAIAVFIAATVTAVQLPPARVATAPPDEAERAELRAAAIRLAASAMGLLRGIVGFLAFMLAFYFKNNDAPLWHLGVAAGAAQLGFFVGAVVAPKARKLVSEERMLLGSLVIVCGGGIACALVGGLPAAALLSLLVGGTSSSAKQAFDAIVQRDAPDANRGRSFARFETRFQLFWVIGALIPVVIPIPAEIGYLVVGGVAGFAVVSYAIGLSQVRSGKQPGKPSRRALSVRLRPGRRAVATPAGPSSDPTAELPPPPAPSSRRPEPPAAGWEPPTGFVSRRLVNGDGGARPTESPPTEPPAGSTGVQPPLPLEGLVPERPTAPATDPDPADYPNPVWRDDDPTRVDPAN